MIKPNETKEAGVAETKLRETELALLLRATSFAAAKHKDQRRKDQTTPYINHPIAVAENLTNIGGITDINTIVAAILHDTIEDTKTTGAGVEKSTSVQRYARLSRK